MTFCDIIEITTNLQVFYILQIDLLPNLKGRLGVPLNTVLYEKFERTILKKIPFFHYNIVLRPRSNDFLCAGVNPINQPYQTQIHVH